jgi:hypothetical protein
MSTRSSRWPARAAAALLPGLTDHSVSLTIIIPDRARVGSGRSRRVNARRPRGSMGHRRRRWRGLSPAPRWEARGLT